MNARIQNKTIETFSSTNARTNAKKFHKYTLKTFVSRFNNDASMKNITNKNENEKMFNKFFIHKLINFVNENFDNQKYFIAGVSTCDNTHTIIVSSLNEHIDNINIEFDVFNNDENDDDDFVNVDVFDIKINSISKMILKNGVETFAYFTNT